MSLSKKEATLSVGLALVSCFLPYLFPPGVWDSIIRISLCLALVWFGCLVAAIIRYRKRGLWFLVGLPFVLYWPFVLFMIGWGCGHDFHQCP